MFYWHDKCGKNRCEISYNIILSILMHISIIEASFFSFILFILIETFAVSQGPESAFLVYSIFKGKNYRFLHHELCTSEKTCWFLGVKREKQDRYNPSLVSRTDEFVANYQTSFSCGAKLTPTLTRKQSSLINLICFWFVYFLLPPQNPF